MPYASNRTGGNRRGNAFDALNVLGFVEARRRVEHPRARSVPSPLFADRMSVAVLDKQLILLAAAGASSECHLWSENGKRLEGCDPSGG